MSRALRILGLAAACAAACVPGSGDESPGTIEKLVPGSRCILIGKVEGMAGKITVTETLWWEGEKPPASLEFPPLGDWRELASPGNEGIWLFPCGEPLKIVCAEQCIPLARKQEVLDILGRMRGKPPSQGNWIRLDRVGGFAGMDDHLTITAKGTLIRRPGSGREGQTSKRVLSPAQREVLKPWLMKYKAFKRVEKDPPDVRDGMEVAFEFRGAGTVEASEETRRAIESWAGGLTR